MWEEGRVALWHPAFPHLGVPSGGSMDDLMELFAWIDGGGLLEAHNAFFEQCLWTNILTPLYDFPLPSSTQWRCSAAKAASHALPRQLEDAGRALRLTISKDVDGAKVMKKLAKPRKSRKAERVLWEKTGATPPKLLWHESPELFARLFQYCQQDVLAEEALSEVLPDLSPHETRMYLMDQRINARGFQLDPTAVNAALSLIGKETISLNSELATITQGRVKKATNRAQMLKWLRGQGVHLDDTKGETLDADIEAATIGPKPLRALQILRTLGRSSTAKYSRMQDHMDPVDFRVRGGLLYHGASTGRWTGSGVQPHNFPKGSCKDIDGLWDALLTQDRPIIVQALQSTCKVTGGVMEALSQGLRGAITASPGKQLYVADYAAIEARVVLWLADDQDALDIFRQGKDIYLDMAEAIYHRACNKKDHPTERSLGKIAVLGLGYQMGAAKFQATCAKFGIVISDELAQQVVDTYRQKYWRVKQLWWDNEAAAIDAVASGSPISCGYVSWRKEGDFLYCVLPSGRRLAYPFPEIRQRQTPWGEMKMALTFMGVNPFNRQWQRQTSYGGSLVENVTQAVARDLLGDAMLRLGKTGVYDVVLTVHDEILAETDSMAGNVQEFEALMARCPQWATGLPVQAEGWKGFRYRK